MPSAWSAGPSGEREVPIDDFLEGPYETSLAFNEMLVEVRIPVRHNTSSAYAKVERRVGDWAVAAAGAAVTLDDDSIAAARVGLTAVNADAGGPRRGVRVPRRRSTPPKRSSPRRAGEPPQACDPVTDMRGSADYKRHLARRTDRANPAHRGRAGARAPEPQGNWERRPCR